MVDLSDDTKFMWVVVGFAATVILLIGFALGLVVRQ